MTKGLRIRSRFRRFKRRHPRILLAARLLFYFSTSFGIAFGFIAWTAIKLLAGQWRQLNPALWILSALFVVKLAYFSA